MFIFGLFSSSSEKGPGSSSSKSSSSKSSSSNKPLETTVISEGASIQGVFDLSAVNLRIAGRVKGDITTDGRIVVAEEATVEGTLEAESIRLEGYVEGDVHAEEKIVLCPPSEVRATLDADVLEIQPGADFVGSVGDESITDVSGSSSDLGSMDFVRVPNASQGGDGAMAKQPPSEPSGEKPPSENPSSEKPPSE